jgi:hypothetical protein
MSKRYKWKPPDRCSKRPGIATSLGKSPMGFKIVYIMKQKNNKNANSNARNANKD